MAEETRNPVGAPKLFPAAPRERQAGKPKEFQRFEDLTRKLAQVPKPEVDAKRGKA